MSTERMQPKRMQPELLTNGAEGYYDPRRPDRGWIRVVTEKNTRLELVKIARSRDVSLSTIVREALWVYLGQTVKKEDGVVHFKGGKNPSRRKRVESGQPLDPEFPVFLTEFSKTATIYAVKMPVEFEVDTPEGLMKAKRGDYLAVGKAGEMYPIDASVFAVTYEKAE